MHLFWPFPLGERRRFQKNQEEAEVATRPSFPKYRHSLSVLCLELSQAACPPHSEDQALPSLLPPLTLLWKRYILGLHVKTGC